MCENFSLGDFTLISMVFGFLPHSEWAAKKIAVRPRLKVGGGGFSE
jgi:hypothetical protein